MFALKKMFGKEMPISKSKLPNLNEDLDGDLLHFKIGADIGHELQI